MLFPYSSLLLYGFWLPYFVFCFNIDTAFDIYACLTMSFFKLLSEDKFILVSEAELRTLSG